MPRLRGIQLIVGAQFGARECPLQKTALICVIASCSFTACDSNLGPSGANHSIGGTVSGLSGSGLVLQYVVGNNATSDLAITSNGSFSFAPHAASGAMYSITVESQPVNPAQICTVSNGSGVLAGADITNVTVNCNQSTRFAYVANKQSNNISAYSINLSGGLTPVAGSPFVSTGSQPDSVWVGPGGQYLYVANSGSSDLSIFSINSGTGVLSPLSTVATGAAPYAIFVDPTGSYLYVSNYSSNNISAYAIDPLSGELNAVSGSPFAVGIAPTSITTDPNGQFLYVANSGSSSVSVLRVDSSTGALSSVAGSPFAAGAGPISVAVDPSGTFAFVANAGASTISEYSISASTGVLVALPGSPLATQSPPTSLTIAGASLFVTDVTQEDNVGTFDIGSAGGLSFSAMTPTGGSPVYIALDPSSQFAYVVCEGTNNVFVYTVSGGSLSPAAPLSVSAGAGPVSIAID
jgi:6-phosphogluconolactonase